jgi:hypothetical protein
VRTAPAVAGYGAALAIVLGTWQFAGGKITGYAVDPTVDEVARKEYMRKNRRRSMEETIEQIGEGRGNQDALWILAASNYMLTSFRNLRTWLPREKSRETAAKLWHPGAFCCCFLIDDLILYIPLSLDHSVAFRITVSHHCLKHKMIMLGL